MQYFAEERATAAVLERIGPDVPARTRAIVASVVANLHTAVREIEPTHEEWLQAVEFLKDVGQTCTDSRQEFILLSDTLGVTLLVDAINNRKPGGATESTILGPFHVKGAPERANGAGIALDGKGEPLLFLGRVLDGNGQPIAGAQIDVWQTNAEGFYDVQQPGEQPAMNLRGLFTAEKDGSFWFRSVKPVSYPLPDDGPVGKMLRTLGRHPYRPAHIHFIISAPGFATVITHIFVRGDEYLESDAVFGVKESLIEEFTDCSDPAEAQERNMTVPYVRATCDFTLARGDG